MTDNDIAITIQQLQYRWNPQQPLLLDIEQLEIVKGERVFIKGESGSGKSTLLSLLAGVLEPQQGDIKILNQSITDIKAAARDRFRADHIGFIFQMFNLLPYLSVVENVLLPLHFSSQRKQSIDVPETEALRLLSHLDMDSPELLSRPVSELSVGQQQRVAAARALMGKPEILIADEPTSALDTDRREAFIKLLINECNESNTTLIFVSHDQALEQYFDRSIHLSELNSAAMTTTGGA